jgi:hypothetical protein
MPVRLRRLPIFFLLSIVASSLIACGADDGRARSRTSASAEASAQREANAKKALKFARSTDTLAAYQDIVTRFEGTDAAGEARLEICRIYANQSREALAAGDRNLARQKALQAEDGADPVLANQLRVTLEQIDRADVRQTSQETKALMDLGAEGCAKAIELVSRTLGEQPSALLLRDLRAQTLQLLTGCASAAIDEGVSSGNFVTARKILTSDATKRAIGEESQHALALDFHDKASSYILERIKPELDARQWESAFDRLAAWGQGGNAGEGELETARQHARDRITSDILSRATAALGGKDAPHVLADIDRALKLFAAMNVSQELASMRELLATWIECDRLKCKAESRPTLVYSLGRNPLLPGPSIAQAAVETLPNASHLWIIARAQKLALVAREEPKDKTWKSRLSIAKGWVDIAALKTQDTTEWIASGKALEGERVWLPGGRDDKLYLLGLVVSVDGQSVTVKKVSDGTTVTLRQDELRAGNLSPGLRVLAFCNDQLNATEGKVDALSAAGGSVRVLCPSGDGKDERAKEEVLGTLRARLEWLPLRRP